MAVMIPKIIPGILAIIIGQSFLDLNEPYIVHAAALMTVMIGKITDPVCPERFSLIWSMYEKYIAMPIKVANHPILFTIFSFII